MEKGRILSREEILKMDGEYVYIKPAYDKYEGGKAKVVVQGDVVYLYSENEFIPWVINSETEDQGVLNNNTWLNVYELIEENKEESIIITKQYTGIEILQMIKDRKLKDGDTYKIVGGLNFKVGGNITPTMASFLNDKFTIIKQKEYITFNEARKSNKMFRYKGWSGFYTLKDTLEYLSTCSYETINKMLDEKSWEIEE